MDEQGWSLESRKSPHGTYRVNQEEKVQGRIQLEKDDILKASHTWLLVREVWRNCHALACRTAHSHVGCEAPVRICRQVR